MWWQNRLGDAIQAARSRYVPGLSIDVSAVAAIAVLRGDLAWRTALIDYIAVLQGRLADVRSAADDGSPLSWPQSGAQEMPWSSLWITWRNMPSTAMGGDIDATLACALTATSGAEGRRCIQLRWGSVVAASSPWRVQAVGTARIGVVSCSSVTVA